MSKMRSTGRFSNAQDEQLIEMVTKYPILWNMESPEFKNTPKKDAIWKEIGEMVNRSDVQCKIRWKSIRDHYKRQKKPTEGVKKRASYWDKLSFLDTADEDDWMTLSSLRSKLEIELQEDLEDICSESMKYEKPTRDNVIVSLASTSGEKRKKIENDHNKTTQNHTEQKEERLKYRRTLDESDDEENEIGLFFKAMAATVKKFDPQTKAEVKMKIFNVVTETEMENIKIRRLSGKNSAKS